MGTSENPDTWYLLTVYHDGTGEEKIKLCRIKLPVCEPKTYTEIHWVYLGRCHW